MEQKKSTKYILIAISVLFIFVMLILPLFSILFSALKEGFAFYIQAVTTEYVRSALLVTLLATVIAVIVNTFFGIMAAWLLTKFSFRGKQVLATLIDIPFSISPVIVGLAFLMTFGIILCTARALGEFGAVNALSKTRGQTFTLPLEIDALYMSGTDTSITSAFAVSSILVIIAVIVLILRNIFEYRSKNSKGIQ